MEDTTFGNVQMVAVIIAVVAALRDRFPKIDGLLVLLVSALVGVGLSYLAGGVDIRTIVIRGIVTAMAASGGMKALAYHAEKSNPNPALDAPASVRMSMRPPPRGFVRTGLLLWTAALGVFAIVGLAVLGAMNTGCSAISKAEVKSVVDITKAIVEEVCSPEDPTLDACIDKLLSSQQYKAARAAHARDAGAQ